MCGNLVERKQCLQLGWERWRWEVVEGLGNNLGIEFKITCLAEHRSRERVEESEEGA